MNWMNLCLDHKVLNATDTKTRVYKFCRAEVRSKKLCSIDVDEKLKLGRELRQMDREQDDIEAELSKYQDKEVNIIVSSIKRKKIVAGTATMMLLHGNLSLKNVSCWSDLQNEILKEERAALRSSLRGTSCTTSSTSRFTPKTTTTFGSPKSSRIPSATTSAFSNGSSSSWRHVDAPTKGTSPPSAKSYSCSSSPTLSSKFGGTGPSAARGPFASRYNDSFSRIGSNDSSPSSSPSHSYTSKNTVKVTTVRTVTTGAGAKSSTMTSYTTQRTQQRPGLGPRSQTLPSRLESDGDRAPSPRGGRDRVQDTLKVHFQIWKIKKQYGGHTCVLKHVLFWFVASCAIFEILLKNICSISFCIVFYTFIGLSTPPHHLWHIYLSLFSVVGVQIQYDFRMLIKRKDF